MSLLMYMKRHNLWHKVGSRWKTWLLPESQIVRISEGDEGERFLMVLRVVEGAALCWPCVQQDGGFFRIDMDASRLVWHTSFDIDSVSVVPCKVLSPIRLLRDGLDVRSGFVFWKSEPFVPLLKWHARSCFAGLQEWVLKQLAIELSVDLNSVPTTEGADVADGYAMTLMGAVFPLLDEESAQRHVCARVMKDSAHHDSYTNDLSTDVVADVVLAGDQKDVNTFVKEHVKLKAARAVRRDALLRTIKSTHGAIATAGVTPAATKKAAAAKQKEDEKKRDHWRAEMLAHPHDAVMKAKPKNLRCVVDRVNGRYLVSSLVHKPKSVSWTRRGHEVAATTTVTLMWCMEHDISGAATPAMYI
jgi:ribosomal protein L12E/L44/L45/RPP1/RPP2